MQHLDVKYFRYMDDILIMARTRCKLKKGIRVLNRILGELKLEKNREKTLIGRTERGFNFLGYHFEQTGVRVADKTVNDFAEKALRLYEQEPPGTRSSRLGEYFIRWRGWAYSGASVVCRL